MAQNLTKDGILEAIRSAAQILGHPPSRSDFKRLSGITEYHFLKFFPSWREAVRSAGLQPDSTNVRLDPTVLLEDWGAIVRQLRHIPTRSQYRNEGSFSPGVFEKNFGPWSKIPSAFLKYSANRPEWADVTALIPLAQENVPLLNNHNQSEIERQPVQPIVPKVRHAKLDSRPTYGNPIDFRGLRHEPVNEQGVVFLFGMLARELGYFVEAMQAGYPDCEAKRQVNVNKWQRVSIEFEFESRNFRDHGHPPDQCDIIVCWQHNWNECPPNIEVVELCSLIRTLASSEE